MRRVFSLSILCITPIAPLIAQLSLEPGTGKSVSLSAAETSTFSIGTQPGNYVRISAAASGTTVELTLLDSAGVKIAAATSLGGTGGVAEAAAIAAGTTLQARVRLPRRDTTPQTVDVSLVALRPASSVDQMDAAAFQAYARALDPKTKDTAAYDEAANLSRKSGDEWLRAAAGVARCLAHLGAAEFVLAAAAAQKALDEDVALTYKRAEGVLLYLQAVARLQHEEGAAAIPLFERAAAIQRDAGQDYELAYSLHNLSVSRWLLGDCGRALEEARQALELRRTSKDRGREAYSLMAIAKDHLCLGDAQNALDTYSEVAPLWRELKDQANQAAVLNDRGLIYSYLGEWAQADAAHQEALAIRTRLNDKAGLVESHTNLGQLQVSQQRYREAQANCERALALAREIHYRRGEAYALLNLAEAQSETGGRVEARGRLVEAARIFAEESHRPGEAWTWQLLSKIDRRSGDAASAIAALNKALTLEREIGDRILESITLVDLARVYRDRGESAQALDYADQAIAVIEESRASLLAPDLRAAWLSSKRSAYGLRIGLLRNTADALATSEQAHARVLLDGLAESREPLRNGIEPELRAALQQTDAEINARAASLARGGSAKATLDLRRELDRSLAKKQEIENRVRTSNPRYAALALPSPATPDLIRKYALDDDTVMLEYFVGEDHSYLWLLTATTLQMYDLPGRAVLEKSVRDFYAALTERNRRPFGETATGKLSRLQRADAEVARSSKLLAGQLLGPVKPDFHARRVIVVPDGPLHLIPFAPLFPATAIPELVYLPSASVLIASRKEQPSPSRQTLPALVIADPVFGADDERIAPSKRGGDSPTGSPLFRLEWSRSEARSIAALAPSAQVETLLDFSAQSDVLRRRDLSSYRVIHLATHALLDTERPSLSGIVFSTVDQQGKAHDGQLRLHEIYNLDLKARLVVLSACRTALGKDVSGEGMIGLSRGFLYAGAESVLATLWSVDDYATAQFMSAFYRALWKEGRTPAAALHTAQQLLMRQPRFRSPYYWAGYTLTGEWR